MEEAKAEIVKSVNLFLFEWGWQTKPLNGHDKFALICNNTPGWPGKVYPFVKELIGFFKAYASTDKKNQFKYTQNDGNDAVYNLRTIDYDYFSIIFKKPFLLTLQYGPANVLNQLKEQLERVTHMRAALGADADYEIARAEFGTTLIDIFLIYFSDTDRVDAFGRFQLALKKLSLQAFQLVSKVIDAGETKIEAKGSQYVLQYPAKREFKSTVFRDGTEKFRDYRDGKRPVMDDSSDDGDEGPVAHHFDQLRDYNWDGTQPEEDDSDEGPVAHHFDQLRDYNLDGTQRDDE